MSALVVFSVAPAWSVDVASLSIEVVIRWSDSAQLRLVGRDPVVEVARGDAARDEPGGDDPGEDHPRRARTPAAPSPVGVARRQATPSPHRIRPTGARVPSTHLQEDRAWSGSGSSGWARWGRRWPPTCAAPGSRSPCGTGRPGRPPDLVALGRPGGRDAGRGRGGLRRRRVLRLRHARRRGRPVRRRRRGARASRAAASSSTARRSRPAPPRRSRSASPIRASQLVDAPVSGGSEGARNATLTIFVGGEPEAFERARPVLEAMGKTITLFGPPGSGQAVKAVNQVMIAGVYLGSPRASSWRCGPGWTRRPSPPRWMAGPRGAGSSRTAAGR